MSQRDEDKKKKVALAYLEVIDSGRRKDGSIMVSPEEYNLICVPEFVTSSKFFNIVEPYAHVTITTSNDNKPMYRVLVKNYDLNREDSLDNNIKGAIRNWEHFKLHRSMYETNVDVGGDFTKIVLSIFYKDTNNRMPMVYDAYGKRDLTKIVSSKVARRFDDLYNFSKL